MRKFLKITYLTYENVYSNPILMTQVLEPYNNLSKEYNVSYNIISFCKKSDKKKNVYYENKKYFEKIKNPKLTITEYIKRIEYKQSILLFILDFLSSIKNILYYSKDSDIYHCRSYGGAFYGYILKLINRKPYIFDMRGLLPEETVEVGKIKKKSYKYKILKYLEYILVKNSDYIFTVSDEFSKYIRIKYKYNKLFNISNPVNYDNFISQKEYDVINLIYSGSIQKWHLPDFTLQLFKQLLDKIKDIKLHLYFCTNDLVRANEIFKKYNIPNNNYTLLNVPSKQMREIYIKTHVGICFREKNIVSKVSCPVKFAEYLASGNYIFTNKGVGDLEYYVKKYKAGLILDNTVINDENIEIIINYIKELKNKKNNKIIYIPEFDWNLKLKQILNIYLEILKINDKY